MDIAHESNAVAGGPAQEGGGGGPAPRPGRAAATAAAQRLAAAAAEETARGLQGGDRFDEYALLKWANVGRVSVRASGVLPGVDTGRGLFAETVFERNDVVTFYHGDVRPAAHCVDAHSTHDAVMPSTRHKRPLILRGNKTVPELDGGVGGAGALPLLLGVGQLANDARGRGNNAARVAIARAAVPHSLSGWDKNTGLVVENSLIVIATRRIAVGEEIWCPYGQVYWKNLEAAMTREGGGALVPPPRPIITAVPPPPERPPAWLWQSLAPAPPSVIPPPPRTVPTEDIDG